MSDSPLIIVEFPKASGDERSSAPIPLPIRGNAPLLEPGHCWHPFDWHPTIGDHYISRCCVDGCKDVLLVGPGVEMEEKTHGGPFLDSKIHRLTIEMIRAARAT